MSRPAKPEPKPEPEPEPKPEPDWLVPLMDEGAIKKALLTRAATKLSPREADDQYRRLAANREMLHNIKRIETAGATRESVTTRSIPRPARGVRPRMWKRQLVRLKTADRATASSRWRSTRTESLMRPTCFMMARAAGWPTAIASPDRGTPAR